MRDLDFDLEIITAPIVRTETGVAMSSRHAYLSDEGLYKAKVINKSLQLAQSMIKRGERDSNVVECAMRDLIQSIPGAKIDYIAFNRWDDLETVATLNGQVMISLAVEIEKVRLLDNKILNIPRAR